MQTWELNWKYGRVALRSSAAIVWECEFQLPSGRRFQPFARAPWAEDPSTDLRLPAHMRYLGGEFVCVPFGIGGAPEGLCAEWNSPSWAIINPAPHGYSADHDWRCESATPEKIVLRLDYPPNDDIAYLTRQLTVVAEAAAIDVELIIHARRVTRQPVGLHPILRLPKWPAELMIDAQFEFGVTYPAHVSPGASRVASGHRFTTLNSIAGLRGGLVDYSRLPKETPTEEMLLLCGVRGPVRVRYPAEQAYFELAWDTEALPSCLLWPSDRALADPPWNQEFRGLGVEPVAAVFDAAREVALEPNPLNAAGIPTSLSIAPESPVVIRYRFAAGDL